MSHLVTIAEEGLVAVKEAALVCNLTPTGAHELAEDIIIVTVLSLGQFTPNMYISFSYKNNLERQRATFRFPIREREKTNFIV